MIQTIDATYDGSVLRPIGPIIFRAGTRVKLTVEAAPAEEAAEPDDEPLPPEAYAFLDTRLAAN